MRAPDALWRAIPERHTNRYGYDRAKSLPAHWREFAAHADIGDDVRVFLFSDGPQRAGFDALVVDATEALIGDPQMARDNTRWERSAQADIEAHRDGVTMDTAGLSPFMLFVSKLIPVSSDMSNSAWLAQTRDTHLPTAPLVGLIAVKDRYDRESTIAAGRTWQRLHLSATVEGIAMQPLNQPIEMVDRERQRGPGRDWDRRVAQLTGPDWQATFSFRAGYSDHAAPPSPRRALKDVVARNRTGGGQTVEKLFALGLQAGEIPEGPQADHRHRGILQRRVDLGRTPRRARRLGLFPGRGRSLHRQGARAADGHPARRRRRHALGKRALRGAAGAHRAFAFRGRVGSVGNRRRGAVGQSLRRRAGAYLHRLAGPDDATVVPITLETGKDDRLANMQAFAKAALELLLRSLG